MADLDVDPLSRFISIHEALNAGRRWWRDASHFPFATIAAVTCPGSSVEVTEAIQRTGEELKRGVGWFDDMRSSLRFVVSALLVRSGDDAGRFLREVERVRALFRSVKLRRGGVYEAMAVLILRQRLNQRPIEESAIDRFQAIYAEMKRYHWCLTGPEDFPACALLVGETGDPAHIGEGIERIYQALGAEGFSSGDPLQTAAMILYLAHLPAETAAQRYGALARGFKERSVSIWQSDYDELAILSFLDVPADRLISRVLALREEMKNLRPKPDRSTIFNLAAAIAFLEAAGQECGPKAIADAKALMDMQSVINAHRAAASSAAAG